MYYSLILSRWFKHRFSARKIEKNTGYVNLIDSKNLTNLTSQQVWSKETYYKQYQKSFAQGEYNIKEPVSTPTGQVIRSYFSGGIKLASSGIETNMVGFTGGKINHEVLTQQELMAITGKAANREIALVSSGINEEDLSEEEERFFDTKTSVDEYIERVKKEARDYLVQQIKGSLKEAIEIAYKENSELAFTNAEELLMLKTGIDKKKAIEILDMAFNMFNQAEPLSSEEDANLQIYFLLRGQGGQEEDYGKTSSSLHQAPERIGAIDFRGPAMNINYEVMGSFKGMDLKFPRLSESQLNKINIDSEIRQIKQMVSSGICPSGARLEEIAAACEQKGKMSVYGDDLLLCIVRACGLAEANGEISSRGFITALARVDSRS